jgi:hypothetical protein
MQLNLRQPLQPTGNINLRCLLRSLLCHNYQSISASSNETIPKAPLPNGILKRTIGA